MSKKVMVVLAAMLMLFAIGIMAAQTEVVKPYSEIESLKIKNLNLEVALIVKTEAELNRAKSDLQQRIDALKVELEAARLGWEWNPSDGSWKKKPVK